MILNTFIRSFAGLKYVELGDKGRISNGWHIRGTPGKQAFLEGKSDGSEVWIIHSPPLGESTSPKARSYESAKYRGYYLMSKNDKIVLDKPTTDELRESIFLEIKSCCLLQRHMIIDIIDRLSTATPINAAFLPRHLFKIQK